MLVSLKKRSLTTDNLSLDLLSLGDARNQVFDIGGASLDPSASTSLRDGHLMAVQRSWALFQGLTATTRRRR